MFTHRRERQKLELRQAILDTAGEMILARGYEAFSLRRVAERVGCSPAAIYLYFDNKDALVAAVIEEGFTRFLAALTAVQTADPLARVGDLGRAYVRFGLENRVAYQLMFMQRADLLRRDGYGSADDSPSFRVLVEAVQAAIDAGAIRSGDARAYSFVLWAAVHGIVTLALTMPELDEATILGSTELMLETLGRGLAPRHQ